MAVIDREYHKLLKKILDEGREKGDRTGTGTISIHEDTLRYNMANGFPLLTTKKMFTKGVITELLWFLSGSTDLRGLVEQRNNIWVGDAYKKYENFANLLEEPNYDVHVDDPNKNITRVMTREEFIERIINDDDFNKQWGDLGPIYGKQWVNWTKVKERYSSEAWDSVKWGGINQLQNVIDTLKTNPDSRRMLVSAWNPADIDEMILPPCHWAFGFYTEELTRDERIQLYIDGYAPKIDKPAGFEDAKLETRNIPKRRLSLKWHQRSCDTFLGIPFNIASYGFLLEMVAQQVNMIPHMLVGDLSNVHIYKNHIDQVNEQLNSDTLKYSAPRLKLNEAKDIFSYKLEDFKIEGYGSYEKITAPLSN